MLEADLSFLVLDMFYAHSYCSISIYCLYFHQVLVKDLWSQSYLWVLLQWTAVKLKLGIQCSIVGF